MAGDSANLNPIAHDTRQRSMLKIAFIALGSALIEWYDFFIYGTAAALIFPTLFFPADLPPLVAQMAAFSTFAIGFVARPVGGVVFGHFGDLYGRKKVLVVAMLLMGGATSCIGLLPTYPQVGALAPVLLVGLRFVQGFAVGGQWGGAALLTIECAPAHRRGFYGSFVQAGVPGGVLLANVVFLITNLAMPWDAFQAWGWRVPFLLSVALVALGLYVQLNLEDSPDFKALSAKKTIENPIPRHSPVLLAIRHHWRDIILAGLAFIASNTCFYVIITYSVAYGTGALHLPRNEMLGAVLIGSVAMIPALMGFAALSDKWGRYRLFLSGAALSGLWAFAFFALLNTGSFVAIAVAVSVGLILLALMYGPQAALFAELFSPEIRYSGASIGYQIGAVLGGGFAPIISTALYAQFGSSHAVASYMAAMCMISLLCTILLDRRQARNGATS